MKQRNLKALLCLLLAVLLAAAVLTGCEKPAETPGTTGASGNSAATADDTVPMVTKNKPRQTEAPTELGEQGVLIYFSVTFADGETSSYAIHTEADNVGDALEQQHLIKGENTEYGLYVKTVCGENLDYETDGMYWAFYVDGQYAQTGVSDTSVTEGAHYAFKAEKG